MTSAISPTQIDEKSSTFIHKPVMLREVFAALEPALEGKVREVGDSDGEMTASNNGIADFATPTFFDLTLGLGGHTEYFLQNLPNINAVGIDRDPVALQMASTRLKKYTQEGRFETYRGTFDEVDQAVKVTGKRPDAVLMDLGVSSMQLDDSERGFAYTKDADLDMRMDQSGESTSLSAKDLIAQLDETELADIINQYGEEKHAKLIAKSLKNALPQTTSQLADAIRGGLPKSLQRSTYAMSSIKRVFQALRIEVNRELDSLEQALPKVAENLNLGGILAVLTYHSLEDRLVKNFFRNGTLAHLTSQVPKEIPIPDDLKSKAYFEIVKAPMGPSLDELVNNSRSKSAKLRVVLKIGEYKSQRNEVTDA
jgi:16S rRNA (cytosine1402-N4)-methyltransferase